jgi:rhodanese-related sulfurtransferase
MNKSAFLILIGFGLVLILVIPTVLNRRLKISESESSQVRLSQKRAAYKNISSKELKELLDAQEDIFLLDVHIPEQEHITGTDTFIPFNQIAQNSSELPEDKDAQIVVYCRSGNMSETASEKLAEMGYTNVKNLSGGINQWKSEGYEL